MYDEQERYSLAIETLERAAEIDPKSPDVWSHMGNSYYAQGEHSKAMDFYRKALGFNPNATHALYSIGVAFADAGIFREAVRYWTKVSEIEPESELGKNAARTSSCCSSTSYPTRVEASATAMPHPERPLGRARPARRDRAPGHERRRGQQRRPRCSCSSAVPVSSA